MLTSICTFYNKTTFYNITVYSEVLIYTAAEMWREYNCPRFEPKET